MPLTRPWSSIAGSQAGLGRGMKLLTVRRVLRMYTGASNLNVASEARSGASISAVTDPEQKELCMKRCGEIRREFMRAGIQVPPSVLMNVIMDVPPENWRKVTNFVY